MATSACADALTSTGLAVAVVNPRQVRDYARSLNILAKTERIDAIETCIHNHVENK